jgi:tetratricopeptide (TPR) repeat protein
VVNLADERPLVLVVDDLQWTDAPSLRFLACLARRVADLPCLLVGALRPTLSAPIEAIRHMPATRERTLPALGVDAVQRLAADALGNECVDQAFATACRAATGGNAFLTVALTRELAERGVRGSAADAAVVDVIGPQEVAASVLRRLEARGTDDLALARAVAVLGPSATYHRACALAELPAAAGDAVLGGLVGAGLLTDGRPLGFVHPIMRTAVHEDLGSGAAGRWHARAAALLAAEGDEEGAARHLRLAEPLGDANVVALLQRAADRALRRGAPDVAAGYLGRALDEPVSPDARVDLLCAAATAELQVGRTEDAERHLQEAVDAAADPQTRGRVLELLGLAVAWHRDLGEVVRLMRSVDPQALTDLRGPGAAVTLSVAGGRAAVIDAVAEMRAHEPADDERLLMAFLACDLAETAGPAARALALARRALADDALLEPAALLTGAQQLAALAATCAGDRDLAIGAFDRAVQRARDVGAASVYARSMTMRAWSHLRFGELAEA